MSVPKHEEDDHSKECAACGEACSHSLCEACHAENIERDMEWKMEKEALNL